MEQHLVPYEMECMKMAMLKHEEIFKQQVYELHRLYRIQKMLMKQQVAPRSKAPKTKHPPPRNEKLPRPSENCFNRYQDDQAIDLRLGLGNYYYSPTISKKLSPTRLISDSVTSFSSSSSDQSSCHSKRVCLAGGNEVEYQEHTLRQDHQAIMEQPPWLFQVMGLNI